MWTFHRGSVTIIVRQADREAHDDEMIDHVSGINEQLQLSKFVEYNIDNQSDITFPEKDKFLISTAIYFTYALKSF